MYQFQKLITIFVLISALFGCEQTFLPEPENHPEAIFEDLWNTFDQQYALFAERQVDWDAQYALYRSQVSAQTSEDELFEILSNLLASLNDGHVSLTAPGRDVFFSNAIRQQQIDDELFDLPVVFNNYLEAGYRLGDEQSYVYGKIKNENLGYVFFDHVGPNFAALSNFLKEYQHVEGIILDLRHNKGGDFTYAFSALGRFTDVSRFVFKSKTKNGEGQQDYTPWQEWFLEPKGEFVDNPITVLTDRYTISAGERAVMALKTLPGVTFIGDTTNGAHGTMIGRSLANGWYYSLVPQKTELFDGNSYEGVGLNPDIFVKNQIHELAAGIDKTLEKAIGEMK